MPDQTPEVNQVPETQNPEVKSEALASPEAPAVQEVNPAVEQPSAPQVVQVPDVNNAVPEPSAQTQSVIDPDDNPQEEKKNKSWVQKANDVIKEYEEEPYEEQEASEKLQEEYLKERFNVNVADEEKN